jgi:predicted DNA-binding transcriptional regulator YafY
MRRIERLINLIAALLETRVPMTAEQIRAQIAGYDQAEDAAFRRTFERDKESLRAMGIPLEVVPTDVLQETPDGYIIPPEKYYLPQLDLEEDELAALRLAAESMRGGAEGESVWLKLSMDSPADEMSGPRIAWGAALAAEQPALSALYSALLDRAPVHFGYRGAGAAETSRRTVEMFGIAYRRGRWYAVGNDRDKSDVRSFRVDRIEGAVKTEVGSYEIPGDFDAAGYLGGEPWEVGPEDARTAVVRFDESVRWWAEQNLASPDAADGPDGSLDVKMTVARPDALVSWVIEFGGPIEIVSPDDLRALVVERVAPYLGAER